MEISKRVEKFIQDYTRSCSNEILSPYPQINNDVRRIDGESAKEFSPWLTPDQALRAVEIAREETLLEVAAWISDTFIFSKQAKEDFSQTFNIMKELL